MGHHYVRRAKPIISTRGDGRITRFSETTTDCATLKRQIAMGRTIPMLIDFISVDSTLLQIKPILYYLSFHTATEAN